MALLQTQRSPTELPPDTAACMGAFDGLHLGHRALIERAAARGDRVALVTFDPHPMQVLAPERAPSLLHTPTLRERAAVALGVGHLVLLPFDRAMSKLDPEEFVRRYLSEGLRPACVVIGRDFRFGARRAGDADLLVELLAGTDIAVEIVDPVPDPALRHGKLSSTDIRAAVDDGDVDRAAALLGRYHSVHGIVVHGHKRGRTIGFPTANVDYAGGGYLPPLGVYATYTTVWSEGSEDYGRSWPSVTNIGRNPTFTGDNAPVTVESHVLDADLGERLYGAEVDIAFVRRLRGEMKFEGPRALIDQIRDDAAAARALLADGDRAGVLHPPERTPSTTTESG